MKVCLDANVLYDSLARDLFLEFTYQQEIQCFWSDAIEQELMKALLNTKQATNHKDFENLKTALRSTFGGCYVQGDERLIQSLALPDPNDRHVLATAIQSNANFIVTFNLKDFPERYLKNYGTKAVLPKGLMEHLIASKPDACGRVLTSMAQRMKKPPISPTALAQKFISQGWTCMEKILPLL